MSLTADVAATLQPGFVGSSVPTWVQTALADGLTSVCLYVDNLSADGSLDAVCDEFHAWFPGTLLATDEEGGDVTRLHHARGAQSVGNGALGRMDDVATTRAVATGIGTELADLGIGLNLAPSVDVNSSPDNPVIGVRSFGADPAVVSRHTAAWVEGLQSTGVAACAKHFPGHGDTVVDSHHGLPTVEVPLGVLRERELAPFRAAVHAGVATVMTSHVVVPALDAHLPATFSPVVLGVLREELGFDGVIVSDALDMAGASAGTGIPEAAVKALHAGVDLLCLGSATSEQTYAAVHDEVVRAVRDGLLPRWRLAEAATRVRALASASVVRLADHSRRAGRPEVSVPDADVARAFRLSDSARRWVSAPGEVAIVQVDSAANLAVGHVPWGPSALGATVAVEDVRPGSKVALVGRDIGAGHLAHGTLQQLRSSGFDVILVECGWPRGGADIETFGGSPGVARTLLAVLAGEVDVP